MKNKNYNQNYSVYDYKIKTSSKPSSHDVPKNYIYFQKIVEIAVSSTKINCNSGMVGLSYVFDSIAMLPGFYFKKTASSKDINIVKSTNNKTSFTFKNRRKPLKCLSLRS